MADKPTYEELEKRVKELEKKVGEYESALSENENASERLDLSLSAGNTAWWEMDVPTGTVRFHRNKTDVLGYRYEDFDGCHYTAFTDLLHPDDHDRAMAAMRDHIEGRKDVYEVDYRIRGADGSYYNFYDKGGVTERDDKGNPLKVKGVIIDISELKQTEADLRRALVDKDHLIREIHHRVKNNLAMVSSLISLQSGQVDDDFVKQKFDELKHRLDVITMLHLKLYRGDVAMVNIRSYLDDIITGLTGSLITDKETVFINREMEDMTVTVENAIILGLLINEILTNSIKYAFPDGRKGEITIRLTCDSGTCGLRVTDNGVGFPEEKFSGSESLGVVLIQSLVDQLDGELKLLTDNGTEYDIRFNLDD